jgi:hypothetical protein
MGASMRRVGEPRREVGILEEEPYRVTEGLEVRGVIDQQPMFVVDDLLGDTADSAGHNGATFPHRFGDREPKGCSPRPDDHDRATGVLGEVLADRPEEETGEAATAPRPDDDHVRRLVVFEEPKRRGAFEHPDLDVE